MSVGSCMSISRSRSPRSAGLSEWMVSNNGLSLIYSPTGRFVGSFHLLLAILTSLQSAEKRFPNLFCLAMDVVLTQASSVSCERLFSSGKETYTASPNRIQPKLMEALQALKFSSRDSSLDPAEHLSDGFHPVLEVCEALEAVCGLCSRSSAHLIYLLVLFVWYLMTL